jgi:hypothetical protein
MVSVKNIARVAGFLEGEGSFGYNRGCFVTAVQVQKEPLLWCQEVFGGTVKPQIQRAENGHDFWRWGLYGLTAVQAMMTLYTLMSAERRAKISSALKAWMVHTRPTTWRALRTHCAQGHPYTERSVVKRPDRKPYRRCHECENTQARHRRATASVGSVA